MRLINADELKKKAKMIDWLCNKQVVSVEDIDNVPTVELTEEQAIDKLHETGWLIRHDKEMTERPQGDLNDSINTIKSVCKSCNTCIECPMNHNCNEQPAHWEVIKYDND